MRHFQQSVCAACCLAVAAFPAAAQSGAADQPGTGAASGKLHIVAGQSILLHSVSSVRRIYVGNPAVLQTVNGGPNETVLTAKEPGVSSLVLWDDQGASHLYAISCDVDPTNLRKSLHDAYPGSAIQVDATEDRITLAGTVPSAEVFEGAAKLAAVYSKSVVNSLLVAPIRAKQVQLKLRIAEVDRTRLEQYAVNLAKSAGNGVASSSTGQFSSVQTSTVGTMQNLLSISNPFNLFFGHVTNGLGVNFQDLESRNILQILSEPNLTTMSGVPARFLSGGEFPFPVAQGGGSGGGVAVTIQFRPYGVKVEFTPTVHEDGTIHLKIAPEVSTLDYTNAVAISGFTIPALSTRRTETEVELKDGESYAISGLLDRRATDNLSKIPGIANVPILGALFKSKNLSHSNTELIVIVTATVVDPGTTPGPAEEPKMPVPVLNKEEFDKAFGPARRMEGEKP